MRWLASEAVSLELELISVCDCPRNVEIASEFSKADLFGFLRRSTFCTVSGLAMEDCLMARWRIPWKDKRQSILSAALLLIQSKVRMNAFQLTFLTNFRYAPFRDFGPISRAVEI